MSKYVIDETTLTGMADQVRRITKNADKMKPQEMISGLSTVDLDAAYSSGKQDGIQSEYDRFWDAYQQNGARSGYIGGFAGIGWTVETFRPKYDIAVTNAYQMFNNFSYNVPINLKQILADCGVSITFPGSYNISQLFYASGVTYIGELDFSTTTRANDTALFQGATLLKSIDKIILPVGQTTFSNWFSNCTALENVLFEGTIAANNFNISWSTKLNHDSLMSIINALADKSEDTSGTTWTVTIGSANYAKLTEEEITLAESKGWVLV